MAPKIFNPKKCHNCQKLFLKRRQLALCPKCYLFVDNAVQVKIAELYNPEWEFTNSPSKDFKAIIEIAIAQAAMGTIKARPISIQFRDYAGSKIERASKVRVPYNNHFYEGKVVALDGTTGLISVRLIADPPDIVDNIDPKTCEVIHERQSDEHPDA